jgi:cytochrome P450
VTTQLSIRDEPPAGALVFDLFSPAFHADPHPSYRRLRDEAPIHRLPVPHAIHVLTRHADVAALLADERLTMNITLWEGREPLGPDDPRERFRRETERSMATQEGAAHARLRKLVNKGFAPRAIAALEPSLRALVDGALAPLLEQERFDLHEGFAQRIPVITIARLIGVPERDEDRFTAWAHRMILAADPLADDAANASSAAAIDELYAYLGELIEARRGAPRGDLLSRLLAAEESGDRLTRDELLSLCQVLLVAGAETTTNLIDLGAKALIDHPAEREKLAREPGLLENAVEEMLRYEHPGKFLNRVPREDVAIRGELLRAGSLVLLGIGSAQRDERVFEDPDRLDVTRDLRESLAFGRGRHSCLGASLARLEGRLALGALLPHLPRLRYEPDALRWRPSLVVRGMDAFPMERVG